MLFGMQFHLFVLNLFITLHDMVGVITPEVVYNQRQATSELKVQVTSVVSSTSKLTS